MYSSDYVLSQIEQLKADGNPLSVVAWMTAKNCVGWAYVFGARGELCTPTNRQKYYASKGADHPTIKSACKNFSGDGSCSGCKWLPGGAKTRFFDCRGFTYWILLQVYGWKLMGAGATSQWNTKENWKAQGEIKNGIPQDTLVCLFVKKGSTMSHTGFGFNDETVECSAGVQYFKQRNKKWTHWGIPACVEGGITMPKEPEKTETVKNRPTIRKGNKNTYVKEAQLKLLQLGYSLGICGADGDFGHATEDAVKKFQKDHGLTVDGVIGPKTWEALDAAEPGKEKVYIVTIKTKDKGIADELVSKYKGTLTEE